MGATLSKLSSVTSMNSLRSDFPNTVPSSMPSPMSLPQSSPIRSILFHQSRSGPLSHEKPITRVSIQSVGDLQYGWSSVRRFPEHNPPPTARRGERPQRGFRPNPDLPSASGRAKLLDAVGVHG